MLRSTVVDIGGGIIKVAGVADFGKKIKQKRKEDGLTLEQAAVISGGSYAFLSALENGKETVRLDKVLQVTKSLGIEFQAQPRSWG